MQKPMLCLGKVAENPYKLNNINVSVSSIEELMYVLGENVYIVDSSMIDRQMQEWIRRECQLEELADKLDRAFADESKQVSVSTFLSILFSYTGYYDRETIAHIDEVLIENAKLSPEERIKNAADFMAKTGYYKTALKLYRQQSDRLGRNHELTPKIMHNMGWVYIKLFLYDRASDLFLDSFSLSGNTESLIQAMAAKRLCMDETAYVEWVTKLGTDISQASEELEKRFIQVSDLIESTRQQRKKAEELLGISVELEDIVENLKADYRKVE